jgi:5-methylcytosine-specific restriction endonuclease McrA
MLELIKLWKDALKNRRFNAVVQMLPKVPQYTRYPGSWSKCVYCGSAADTQDHVLPISLAVSMPQRKWHAELLQLVPACRSCNSTAGDRLFLSLEAKRRYISERKMLALRRHFMKLISEAVLQECRCESGSLCLKLRRGVKSE